MKESVKASVTKILDSYLEASNHRRTPERYAILDAVYSIGGHFTLEELRDRLTETNHFPVSRATIYNTLRLFMELRLVMRHNIQGTTKYEACLAGGNHSHQVCTICGRVTEVKLPKVDAALAQSQLKRFRSEGYALYIYGVCNACQTRMKRAKAEHDKATQAKTEAKTKPGND